MKKELPVWCQRLREARERKRLQLPELAAKAQVSVRTVYRAENEGTIPGNKLITRLALTLGENPVQWVELAGRPVPSEDYIATQKKQLSQHISNDGGIAFHAMLEEIGKHGDKGVSLEAPALMCVCYSSEPSGVHMDPIAAAVTNLINQGIFLAMFLPFPIVGVLKRTNMCALTYDHISDSVLALGTKYRLEVNEEAKSRIRLYVPVVEELLVVPPPSEIPLRPTLVCFKPGSREPDDYRIGSIFQRPGTDEPLWHDMPEPMIETWKAYFAPALRNWEECDGPVCARWAEANPYSERSWVQYNLDTDQPDGTTVKLADIVRNSADVRERAQKKEKKP